MKHRGIHHKTGTHQLEHENITKIRTLLLSMNDNSLTNNYYCIMRYFKTHLYNYKTKINRLMK